MSVRTSATPTGIQLIDTIHEKLLTSVELTGIWEKKLREIEQNKYDAATFINELKDQVSRIVNDVLHDNSGQYIVDSEEKEVKSAEGKKKKNEGKKDSSAPKAKKGKLKVKEGDVCPKCGKGRILKGKTAYGCSRWKEGCDFRAPLK